MNFSNKSLIILAVGVLAISIFGTSLSLNLIDGMSNTGYASNSGTGDVNLSINSTVSIVMNDSIIDFGQCNLVLTNMTFNSSLTAANGNLSNCSNAGAFPDFLVVENDGNSYANVTVQVDALPSTVYGDATTATLDFMTEGFPTRSGCGAAYDQPWTTMTLSAVNACSNMTYVDTSDRFRLAVAIKLPNTASSASDDSMRFTFTASSVS